MLLDCTEILPHGNLLFVLVLSSSEVLLSCLFSSTMILHCVALNFECLLIEDMSRKCMEHHDLTQKYRPVVEVP